MARAGSPTVTVQIAGQRYALKSSGDEERTKRIAAFVDGRIKDVSRHTRTVDSHAHAILAALQIAEELFDAKDATVELRRRVRDRTRTLLRFLEQKAGV
jgi:cell division protein ZapA